MLLSDKQLKRVETILNDSNLKNFQLQIDLLDHIASFIEERMENGENFEESLNEVLKTYSPEHIKEIEHITYILTKDIMQKRTKILGIIGLLFTAAGVSMKIFHLAGAAVTMIVGVSILGIGFFGSNTVDTLRNIGTIKGKIVQLLGAFGAVITLSAAIFKVFHLPGSPVMSMIGPTLLIIYFSFSSFIKTRMLEK